jgi:RNA polymerase sigma-70 factor (ECF subfamily)
MSHRDPKFPPETTEEFSAFLEAYYDRIFAYAWRALGSKEDAEDLTQEICLSLPKRLSGFRGECSPTTWLYRIVTNAAIDMMRKRSTATRKTKFSAQEIERNAIEGHEKTKQQDWLMSAFTSLPDDLRITAALLVEEGLSQHEAAERLNIAPGTVAWRMNKIKQLLKEVSETYDG